jgi:hypothetical protein
MEGSVLNFLKAEWKVSDIGSAHWASSKTAHSLFEWSDTSTQRLLVQLANAIKIKLCALV